MRTATTSRTGQRVDRAGALLLAALAIVLDGFDGQLIGFAIPVLIREWGITRGAFAPAVAAGLIGMGIVCVALFAVRRHIPRLSHVRQRSCAKGKNWPARRRDGGRVGRYSVVRTCQSSGNSTTSSILRRYGAPLVPPVPCLKPMMRSTVVT